MKTRQSYSGLRSPRRLYGSVVCAGLWALGCGAGAEDGALAEDGTADVVAETDAVDQAEQTFNVWPTVGVSLMPLVKAGGSIRVCLQGPALPAINVTQLQWLTAFSIKSWLDAMRPTSKVPLLTGSEVVFTCSLPSMTIHVHSDSAETIVFPHNFLKLSTVEVFGPRYAEVMVHEFGHVFGLADTYLTSGGCQPGQPTSIMCTVGSTALLQDDINGIQEAFCSVFPNDCKRRWQGTPNFCTAAGSELKVGDFNGDTRTDLLCHGTASGTKAVLLAGATGTLPNTPSWTSSGIWCGGAGNQLHIGDVNGDGRADMVCHSSGSGQKFVALATASGTFPTTNWFGGNFCAGSGQLHLGDFNGDGRADLLCHDPVFGAKSVALASATGTFPVTSWSGAVGFCAGANMQLHVGKFNADARTDILCHNVTTGEKAVSLANASGSFNAGATWASSGLNWCAGSLVLRTGDFNGDGRTDLLCHEPAGSGQKWISFAEPGGSFLGTSRYWAMNWCAAPGAQIHVGNFDGGAGATSDFLCHQPASGVEQIAYQFP